GGGVFLEADRDMDMGLDSTGVGVVGQGAATECFDVAEMDFRPDGSSRVVEAVAGADEVDLAEPGDERGNVALANVVGAAEFVEGGVEVVAVVEDEAEGSSEAEFVGTHHWSL